jgi:hypothetical protein
MRVKLNFAHKPMIANIPFALTECLSPKEVGQLLEVAESEGSSPEAVITEAVREFLAGRRDHQMKLPFENKGERRLAGV